SPLGPGVRARPGGLGACARRQDDLRHRRALAFSGRGGAARGLDRSWFRRPWLGRSGAGPVRAAAAQLSAARGPPAWDARGTTGHVLFGTTARAAVLARALLGRRRGP